MQYDPIKKSLGKVFNSTPSLRVLFYKLLDLLLLRSWHIRKDLKKWHRIAAPDSTIMDAGSGFGQYSYFLSSLSNRYNVLAVDIKDEQIEDCNNFFNKIDRANRVRFENQDLVTFSTEASFDLILSVDVMEHILEDEKVFANFHKSLKKGGMLLISTPSDQGGSDNDHHEHDEVHGFIDEHVRDGYNMEDIKQKLLRAGFSKVEARYSYGTPGSFAWKLSMKFPIIALNASKLFFILLPFYYLLTFPFCLILNYLDLKGNHSTGTGLIVKAFK